MLNTQVAGQSLFAGTATDGAALAPADAILADLDALAAGAATAADAIAAIEAYFAAPAGAFYATGYIGAPDDLTPGRDRRGAARSTTALRADADELVAVLQAQAMAAVVAGGAFAGDPAEQMALLGEAGDAAARRQGGRPRPARARSASSQEAVERARAERVSERDTLDARPRQARGGRPARGGLDLPDACRCSSNRSTP